MNINIAWLYPDTLNLHGDRGNIMAFERVAAKLGVDVTITRIDAYDQTIDFDNTDIILMNPGEVRAIKRLVDVLAKQRTALKDYVEAGKVFFAVGTTGVALGKGIKYLDGSKTTCLGLLDMVAKEREMIYGNDIQFTMADDASMEIVGSQIQLVDTKVDSKNALGNVVYGYGNNNDKTEGARYKNLMFTNALGPVLVKNPWLAEYMLRIAAKNKGETIDAPSPDYKLEKDSNESIKAFIASKE